MKHFTAEGRFECGMDAVIAGKAWAFVAVMPPKGGPAAALGLAIANEAGYTPVPLHWCHADSWAEMEAHAEALNRAEGISDDAATRIVCSTFAAQNRKAAR